MGRGYWAYVLASALLLMACEPNEDFGPQTVDDEKGNGFESLANKVLIGCEGNFQNSNASISVYDKVSNEVSGSAFFEVNGRELGDVLQSLVQYGDTLVAVANNSGEVVFCDANTLELIGSVSGLPTPRYAFRSGKELWVTDLFGKAIHIIDFQNMVKIGEIETNGWTERMSDYLETVLIADLDNRQVMSIDVNDRSVSTLLDLSFVPRFLSTYDSLLVMAGEKGTLEEGNTETIIQLYDLKNQRIVLTEEVGKAFANADIDRVDGFFYALLQDELQVFDLQTLSKQVFSHAARTPYGLGLDREAQVLYVCDAIDFIRFGKIFRYSTQGMLIDSVDAKGYIPQSVLPLF